MCLARMSLICTRECFIPLNITHIAKLFVDGTDFRIEEPRSFEIKWYSHQFKGPGLRDKIVLYIISKHIYWVSRGFPCWSYPDLKIFRSGLKNELLKNKRVLANGRYTQEGRNRVKGHCEDTTDIESVV